MFCSNCGQELAPDSKFCSNCGAPVNAGAPVSTPAENDRERERREDFERAWGASDSSATESVDEPESLSDEPASTNEPTDIDQAGGFASRRAQWEIDRDNLRQQPIDEWSMTDLGPAKPQRRRTWLWVLLGIIAVIVIACCVFGWWLSTDSGTEWFEGIATQAAEEINRATETVATPAP